MLKGGLLATCMALLLALVAPEAKAQATNATAGVFQFVSAKFIATEGESNVGGQTLNVPGAYITVMRTGGLTGRILVDYSTTNAVKTNESAKAGTDYTETKGTLTFDDFQNSATFFVPIQENTATNTNKFDLSFQVILSNPRPSPDDDQSLVAVLGKQTNAVVSIYDNDFSYNMERAYYRASSRSGRATVTVLYTAGAKNDFSVDYATAPVNGGSGQPGSENAVEGEDYEQTSGTLTFSEGDTSKTIEIPLLLNAANTFNRDFQVVLSNPKASVTGTVTNITTETNESGVITTNITTEEKDVALPLGKVTSCIVTILPSAPDNGEVGGALAAGAIDPKFNPERNPDTEPAYNPVPGANNTVNAIAVQGDGKIILGGDFTAYNANSRVRVARVDENGMNDDTFSTGTGADGSVNVIKIAGNGDVLLGGTFKSINGVPRYSLGRLNSDGTVDTAFNPGASINGAVRAIELNGNRVLIGGDFNIVQGRNRSSIAQVLADGSIDESFDPGLGANGPVYAMLRQQDGRIVIGGDFTAVGGVSCGSVARLNSNGSLDTTFSAGGGADGPVYALGIIEAPVVSFAATRQPDGGPHTNTVVLGRNQGSVIVNYLFNSNGSSELTNTLSIYYETKRVATTTVVVAATNNALGNLTANFGPGTANSFRVVVNEGYETNENRWSYAGVATALDTNVGKILIAGAFTTVDLRNRAGVAQLNSDGSLDETYEVGAGADGPVYDLKVDRMGNAYIGGAFTSFNGARRVGLARLYASGELDTTFMDTAFNQYAGLSVLRSIDPRPFINSIEILEDGNLIVGGYFNYMGGLLSAATYNDPSTKDPAINDYEYAAGRASRATRYNFAKVMGGASPGPGNMLFASKQYSVDENGGSITLSIKRENGSLGGSTLAVSTADGSALNGDDYTAVSNKVVRWNNRDAAAKNISIAIKNDGKAEGDQSFYVTASVADNSFLLNGLPIPAYPSLGRREATVTVLDSATPPSYVSFSDAGFNVDENTANAVISIVRTGNLSGRISVDYSTKVLTNLPAASTAQPNVNYLSRQGTVTFESGQTNKIVNVPVIDNTIVDPDKMFGMVLVNPRGNNVWLSGATNAVVTIVDNDYAPGKLTFVSTNYDAMENGGMVTVAVKRQGGNLGVVSVDYTTENITAIDGVNYQGGVGKLSWSSGESGEKRFSIPLLDDALAESNKTFKVVLNNFVNALPGLWTNTIVKIADDDSFGKISFVTTNYLVGENEGHVTLIVRRVGGVAGDVSGSYRTQSGSAKDGVDYVSVTNSFSLASGQLSTNIDIQILDDGVASTNKTFSVVLFGAVNATLGANVNATVTVIDRESYNLPPGQLDTAFTATGADNFVYALGPQADGKLIVAGNFTTFNKVTRKLITRLKTDGQLDEKFDVGQGPNDSVRVVQVMNDGRILLGGLFTMFNGVNRNHIVRINSDGTMDSKFNPGAGADNPVYAIVVQPDGKIIVGGDFATFNGVSRGRIVRLYSDGSVDPSFDPGAGINGPVYALALQDDGKLLVGGRFSTANNVVQNSLVRLNADGSVDASFYIGAGPDAPVHALAVQYDGRILVGGQFRTYDGASVGGIVRVGQDGAVDVTFNSGTGADDAIYAIALQNDGRIMVGGDFTHFNDVTRNRVTRLRVDGTVDPTINFGTGANSFIAAIAIQPDRDIVLGGGFTEFNSESKRYVARIHGGVALDAGKLEFNVARYSVSEKDTNAVVRIIRSGGTTGTITADFATVDATAQAGLDYFGLSKTLTFAEGETIQTVLVPILDDTLAEEEEYVDLVLTNLTGGAVLGPQPTAQIVIISDDTSIGFSSTSFAVNENVGSGQATIAVTRSGGTNTTVSVDYYTSDGTAYQNTDYLPGYGTIVFLPGETMKTFPVGIIDDTTVQGNHTVNLHLYNATGAAVISVDSAVLTIVDNDFAPGQLQFSKATYQIGESGTNAVITVQRVNGFTGVVSVKFATSDGTARAGVKYVAAAQTLAFADGETSKTILIGIINNEIVEGDQSVNLTLSNPSGGATLGSRSTAIISIADDDFGPGSIDNTFSIGSGANGAVRAIEQQYDGQIVIGGSFTTFNGVSRSRVARLGTNGAVDSAFAPVVDGKVSAVNTLKDGRVVIGGEFRNVNSASRSWVARLSSNGQSDPAFFGVSGVNGAVVAMFTQPDNRVVVGGDFVMPTADCLRLNDNGSLDITFNPDGGTDGIVNAIARQADGSYIIGGQFTKVGGIARGSLARVNALGLLDSTFASGTGVNGTVYAIAVQADGKVIVGGSFSQINGIACNNIARFYADGAVDLAFAANVTVDGPVYALYMQNDGRFFVGGNFSTVNGESRACLARINRDGTLDNVFMPGSGANGPVYAISMQMDGKVLVAGNFSLMNGAQLNGVARLLGDDGSKGLVGVVGGSKGVINLALAVQVGGVYQLQTSGDLTNWTSIGTNYLATNSPMLFSESITPTNLFFRAVRYDGYRLTTENMTNGNLVTFSVLAGKPYLIQASDNEVDWAVLATNSSVTTTLKHLDRTAVGLTNRSYRAVRFVQP